MTKIEIPEDSGGRGGIVAVLLARIAELEAEVERLKVELGATGDTRHMAMEASIRVQHSYSMQIDELKRERGTLRDSLDDARAIIQKAVDAAQALAPFVLAYQKPPPEQAE